ncbi:hypothetical protein L1887_30038 [Cichorium endivia]|nr:hypothetical protein L1887_30038 [Cichorium endivia]
MATGINFTKYSFITTPPVARFHPPPQQNPLSFRLRNLPKHRQQPFLSFLVFTGVSVSDPLTSALNEPPLTPAATRVLVLYRLVRFPISHSKNVVRLCFYLLS